VIEIHASAGEFAGDGGVIEVGCVTKEAELESALAGGCAMAGTGIAARLGQDGEDVEVEGFLGPGGLDEEDEGEAEDDPKGEREQGCDAGKDVRCQETAYSYWYSYSGRWGVAGWSSGFEYEYRPAG